MVILRVVTQVALYSKSEMQFFLVDDDLEAWILSSLRIPNLIEWSILRLPLLLILSCGHYYHNVRQRSLFSTLGYFMY